MDMNSTAFQKRLLVGVVAFMLAQMAVGVLIAFLFVTERFFLLSMSGVVLGLLGNVLSFLLFWKAGNRPVLIASIILTPIWIALGVFMVWLRLTAPPNSLLLK
jgi:hypothetical protein